MTKREKKKLEKARKRVKNERCHVCTRWRLLTDEHFPPQSAGNNQWIWAHTVNGMIIGQKSNTIAPPMEYRDGLKRRSICQKCNHDTQQSYNAAFKDWTDQARAVLLPSADTESVEVTFKQIEPLAIIKQIITGALAACDYSLAPEAGHMRRAVLNPDESGLVSGIRVLTYLNPPRPSEEEEITLTTKRVCWNLTQINVASGRKMFTFAEYAHNPLGYVVLFNSPPFSLVETAEELAELTAFATYGWREKADVKMRLPVRNPFGPVSCHFANVKGGGQWFKNDADAEAGIALPAPTKRKPQRLQSCQ